MTVSQSYKTTLVLPFVENVHNVLIAFLRTSEFGEWKVDTEKSGDQFVMHFIRGKWRKPMLFGRGAVPAMHNMCGNGELVAETVPMRLDVKLLPSPQDLTITLEHEIHGVDIPSWGLSKVEEARFETYMGQWKRIIVAELANLRAYLKKCYNLPDLPRLVE